MFVKSLFLVNYRNYLKENFSFHRNFNLILGRNGQGKTNLLEAIHMLCNFSPFKKIAFEEIIRFGCEETRLKGEISGSDIINEVNIHLTANKKIVRYNNKVIYRTKKYSNLHKTVVFLPKDTELIKGSASGRRNYLDSFISTGDLEYYKYIQNYYKALKQKKALLFNFNNLNKPLIEIWNRKLSEIGEKIADRRLAVIKQFNPLLNDYYGIISGSDSPVEIEYDYSFKITSDYKDDMFAALYRNFETDLKIKSTCLGAHRDRINFKINGRDSSRFASQGEAKSFVLALKLSEIQLLKKLSGEYPVLILDDITSELDDLRRTHLNGYLNKYSGQIFITTTGMDKSFIDKADKIIRIDNGRLIS